MLRASGGAYALKTRTLTNPTRYWVRITLRPLRISPALPMPAFVSRSKADLTTLDCVNKYPCFIGDASVDTDPSDIGSGIP